MSQIKEKYIKKILVEQGLSDEEQRLFWTKHNIQKWYLRVQASALALAVCGMVMTVSAGFFLLERMEWVHRTAYVTYAKPIEVKKRKETLRGTHVEFVYKVDGKLLAAVSNVSGRPNFKPGMKIKVMTHPDDVTKVKVIVSDDSSYHNFFLWGLVMTIVCLSVYFRTKQNEEQRMLKAVRELERNRNSNRH